ncbi:coiled-coil domain-containing protein, partial [Anaplasma marginale]
MSMGDVRRLKKEVVGSIGRGTASPVRAMFSREISDGDTLLAGEMVGVDEGLVIQELSRPEELEKLQHELAKQVSKLAELGELKWLEELEKLETEELTARVQELKEKGRLTKVQENLKKLGLEKLAAAMKEVGLEELRLRVVRATQELRALEEKLESKTQLQEIQKLKELREELRLEELKGLEKEVGRLKLEDLNRLEIEKLRALVKEGLGDLERLEAKKLEEVETAKEGVSFFPGIRELTKTGKESELLERLEVALQAAKKLEEVGGNTGFKGQVDMLKNLKSKLGELAAIRVLKEGPELATQLRELKKEALDLGEQLRMLAEIKEVKGLAKKRQDGGLEIQEGLQLTTRTVALERNLAEKVSKLDREKELGRQIERIKALEGGDIAKLGRQIERIRGLEDLAVSKKLKAALASAMEIAKNRGWTDYLNSLDVSERANAARELIAAEKIRKWARDINNLDADER